MECTIKLATISDKVIIKNLLQPYLHELSEFQHMSLNEHGEYNYLHLDHYWTEKDRYPYLLFHRKEIMGFALVRKEENLYSMAEFFILPKFRGHGFGQKCALHVIQKHIGGWRIEFLNRNEIGGRFWRKAIKTIVGGSIEEGKADDVFSYLQFSVKKSHTC